MRRKIKTIFVFAVAAAITVFIALPAVSQDKPADNMQILLEKIRADKKLLVAANMELTTVDGNKVDDFFVTNVTLFSQNLVKGLSASFCVYNLFDKKYRDPSGDEITQKFVEQDGRNYRLKLTYAF